MEREKVHGINRRAGTITWTVVAMDIWYTDFDESLISLPSIYSLSDNKNVGSTIDMSKKHRKTIKFELTNKPRILVQLAIRATQFWNYCITLHREHYNKNRTNLSYNVFWDKYFSKNGSHNSYFKKITKGSGVAASFQELVKQSCKAYKGYKEALEAFKYDPSGFSGRPRPPKLKGGFKTLPLTSRQLSISTKTDEIRFPKKLRKDPEFSQNTFNLREAFTSLEEFDFSGRGNNLTASIKYIPTTDKIICFLTFRYIPVVEQTVKTDWSIAIDPNLAVIAFVSNTGLPPVIIDMNDFLNFREDIDKKLVKKKAASKASKELWHEQEIKIYQYWSVLAKFIVNYCVDNNISKIIAGKVKGQKKGINLGRNTNRKFHSIARSTLYRRLEELANDNGITYMEQSERYTSRVCYRCGELPTYTNYNIKRRMFRSLWKCGHGHQIHADVNLLYCVDNNTNSAANIGVKADPSGFIGKVQVYRPVTIRNLGENFLGKKFLVKD